MQLKYLRQLHTLLSDPQAKKSAAHRDIIKFSRSLAASLFEKLDPPPVALPPHALPAPAPAPAADVIDMADGDENQAGPSGLTERNVAAHLAALRQAEEVGKDPAQASGEAAQPECACKLGSPSHV